MRTDRDGIPRRVRACEPGPGRTPASGAPRAHLLGAVGNRALQRALLPATGLPAVQRATITVLEGRPDAIDDRITGALQKILNAVEARAPRARVGRSLTRLETLLGVPVSRDDGDDTTTTTTTPAPAPVPMPMPALVPTTPEAVAERVSEEAPGEGSGPPKRRRTAEVLTVDEPKEPMEHEPPALPPVEAPTPAPVRGSEAPPDRPNKRKRAASASSKEKNDTRGLSAAYADAGDGSEVETIYIEGDGAFRKAMKKAIGPATARRKLGKRKTGTHSEMTHVTENPNVRAVAASQAACLLCYGFLEEKRIEHGPLKDVPYWTDLWTHGPEGFSLRRGNEISTNPKIKLTADGFGAKTYKVQDNRPAKKEKK